LIVTPGGASAPALAPFAIRRGEQWDPLEQIVTSQVEEHVASLVVRSRAGVEAQMRLELDDQVLTVTWSVTDCPPGQVLNQTLALAPAGHWYGFGHHEPMYWPLERGEIFLEPCAASNVRSPIWLTSSGLGLLVPEHETMRLDFNSGGNSPPTPVPSLKGEESGLISWGVVDCLQSRYQLLVTRNIEEARQVLVELVGRPQRRPQRASFARPIFSTWTQFGKAITQEQVLHLARDTRRHDFPAYVVQIDERWERAYGDLVFDRSKFPDPGAMVQEIHDLGCKATLWACPFVNEDSVTFSEEYDTGYLVPNAAGTGPALLRWWDGVAGLVDLSNPQAVQKYAGRLQRLVDEYGFDGFKFDGGDARYQPQGEDRNFHLPTTPSGYCDLYQQFIYDYFYDLAESRTAWLAQRFGTISREGGKDSVWDLDNGLAAMIALGLTQSLMGYPYLIPDMIGGRIRTRDADLPLPAATMFLRWVQASVLMPIMQYSWAPWNYDCNTVDLAREYTRLHEDLADEFDALADLAMREGQPMIRPLFLQGPEDTETYPLYNEYLLGEDLLVAPVITPDNRRQVYLPEGEWVDPWREETVRGPRWLDEIEVPVHVLPMWVKIERKDLAEKLTARVRQIPAFAGGGR